MFNHCWHLQNNLQISYADILVYDALFQKWQEVKKFVTQQFRLNKVNLNNVGEKCMLFH